MKKKSSMFKLTAAAFCISIGLFSSVTVSAEAEDDVLYEQQTYEEVIPEIDGLTFESQLDLDYAERFDLYRYNDGYAVLDIYESRKYLIVPEGMPVPSGAEKDYVILQKPFDHIYLTSTSVMSLFNAIGAIDDIKLSGTQASGWYVPEAVEALENGSMQFAGKYSEPDYELLLKSGCNLSVQSTMILHSPKTQEMLEDLGIPVLVDYSTYEQHPLGKIEWIKLYGFLQDKEEAASEFLMHEKAIIDSLDEYEKIDKTVAYFFVNSNGQVVVREITDSIPRMISMAGGKYIYDQPVSEDVTKSSATITMEAFYNAAINADYIIYNATIDSPISTIDELLAKSELFADFKAVKEGNVWCSGKAMFQRADKTAEFILDMNHMLNGSDGSDMTFFNKVQ